MKLSSLFLLLAVLFALYGCNNDESLTQILADEKLQQVLGFPERIPADAGITGLIINQENDWTVYDDYYRTKAIHLKEEPYFRNLQWVTIEQIINCSEFISTAPSNKKLFYLNEILSRPYINNPTAIVPLLNVISSTDPSLSAKAARLVISTNKEFLSSTNYEKHTTKYQNAYNQLMSLGYNRWGQDL